MSNFNYKADGTGALFLAVLNTSLNKLDKSITNFKADFNVNYRISYDLVVPAIYESY